MYSWEKIQRERAELEAKGKLKPGFVPTEQDLMLFARQQKGGSIDATKSAQLNLGAYATKPQVRKN